MDTATRTAQTATAAQASECLDVLVIGAGFAGIGMGFELKRAGHRFVILEQAEEIGGTWRDNTYPGCACDTESHHYSYSFAPNPDWTRRFAPQPEILAYLKKVAADFGLLEHIRLGEATERLSYDAEKGLWSAQTSGGRRFEARFVAAAVGQLNHPSEPVISGLDSFSGAHFHSAKWDHEYDFRGKKVAVIGSGASAIQLIPPLAEAAARLTVFQRSPNWIVPKNDREFSKLEKHLFRRLPLWARLYRYWIYWSWESSWPEFLTESRTARRRTAEIVKDIARRVAPASLRSAMTPDYPLGCKRILLADNFYPAMQRDNVTLAEAPIDHIDRSAIVTADGVRHEVDCIVMATGFKSHDFLKGLEVRGREDQEIHATWNGTPEAYLGISVPGFPNFFLLYGPNTNLGHNSIIFMIECQAHYISRLISEAMTRNAKSLEVTPRAMTDFYRELERDMARTAWVGGCSSWYKNAEGRVINNWSSHTLKYWWRTRRPNLEDYVIDGAAPDGIMEYSNG